MKFMKIADGGVNGTSANAISCYADASVMLQLCRYGDTCPLLPLGSRLEPEIRQVLTPNIHIREITS